MNGRRTRKQQIMTMSIIAVAIITLSIGFAAFSSTLRISSTASVNPDSDNFSVVFSSNANTLETNDITASPASLGDPAEIANGTVPTISGLNAKFTSPGQTVTYTFYALNIGAYLAHLNYINFNNVEGESKNIKCEAGEETNADLVSQACNGISINVKVGSDQPVSTSQSGISNHTLSAGTSETVIVTISYNTGSTLADGPFNVTFGDIELIYSSVADFVPQVAKTCTYEDLDNSGTINLSDTVKCGSENFYVMSNDGSNVTMLTEKNIKVDLTSPIQSDSAGTIVYAETKYWVDDSDSLLSKYGTTTPAYIYDENSSIFEYVEAYETYLKETLKVSSASATLISYEQVENLGCDETKFTCGPDLGNGGLETSAPSWVYSTNYWIGSISKYLDYVYRIDSRGEFYSWMYSDLNANFGIRPVVTISVNELN